MSERIGILDICFADSLRKLTIHKGNYWRESMTVGKKAAQRKTAFGEEK